jgi:hypothetical protein
VSAVNGLLRSAFDLLLFPFRSFPPMVGLLVVSLVASIGILLFRDDVPAILRAQMEILRHNLNYLFLSLVPMLWMMVPLLLVIAQLQFHYGYRGLRPGEDFIVKVRLKDPSSTRPAAALEAPPGLEVATPAVWIPAERELAWRMRAQAWGDYELKVRLGGKEYSKTAQVSRQVRRRSPERLEPGFLNELLYPAEDPLPGESPIASIALGYPEDSVSLLGWHVQWMIAFFVLSVVFAFALRGRMGVTL